MTTLSYKLKETNERQKHEHVACSNCGKKTDKYGGGAKKEHLLTTLHALGKALESRDKALWNVIVLCFPGVVHSTYKHIYGRMHVHMC